MSVLNLDTISSLSGDSIAIDAHLILGVSGVAKALLVWGDIRGKADLTIGSNDVIVTDDENELVNIKGLRVVDNKGAGLNDTLTLTNGTQAAGSGAGVVKTTSGTPDSAGFIKAYVGTDLVYIPYFITMT